jgi:hypothetical protein
MSILLSRTFTPAALLYIFLIVTQAASGIYLAGRLEPPPPFALLYTFGFLWVTGWWLSDDGRKRGVAWVLDMGLFLYVAWPIVMPYYLLKTRGAKGLLVILCFLGAYVGALAAGITLYVLLNPQPG